MSDWKKGLPCEVVKDILPLYVDEVVNDVTAELVKEHVEGCESCRREYQTYQDEVPKVEGESRNTKEKFNQMMDSLKRKQRWKIVLTVVCTCLLIGVSWYVLTQVSLVSVPDSEAQLLRVYRFEDEGEEKFYLYYLMPNYSPMEWHTLLESGKNGTCVVKLHAKRPILSSIRDWCPLLPDVGVYSTEWKGTEFKCKKLYLGDSVIWSEEENGKDDVPEYVQIYNRYLYHNHDGEIETWTSDYEEGYVGAIFKDGKEIDWDLDGNVIYEGEKKE